MRRLSSSDSASRARRSTISIVYELLSLSINTKMGGALRAQRIDSEAYARDRCRNLRDMLRERHGLLGSAGIANTAIARRSFDAGIAIARIRRAAGVDGRVRFIPQPACRRSRVALDGGGAGQCDSRDCVQFGCSRRMCPAHCTSSSRAARAGARWLAFDLIGSSAAMNEVRQAVHRAASAPFTVLIEGECGSGKELVANAIHRAGCRRERRFCAFNCAAMPEDLVDAELFGHAKGAFTGAAGERVGLFESADGGTVFLDEVGELSARAQAKILRVLQEGEIRRIGENFTRRFDARLVAATHRSLLADGRGWTLSSGPAVIGST